MHPASVPLSYRPGAWSPGHYLAQSIGFNILTDAPVGGSLNSTQANDCIQIDPLIIEGLMEGTRELMLGSSFRIGSEKLLAGCMKR